MRNTRSLKRNLAVILAAVMLVVAIPGYFLSASAAESVSSEEGEQEEMLLSSEGSTSPEYAPEEEPEALEEENQPEAEEESVIQEEESQEAAEEEPVVLEEDPAVPEEENAAIPEEDLVMEEVKTQTNAASHPVIALTYVPPYGTSAPVTGVVFNEDGSSFNPADYRIAAYVQVTENSYEHYPKPTYDHPYTDLGDDGTFSAVINTASSDSQCKILHIMLISSSFLQNSFEDCEEHAFDYVKVIRSEDGEITINPEREAPPTPFAEPAIDAPFSVSQDTIGFDVGFYTDGSMAGSALSEAQIRQHLEAIAEYTDTVRFYSASGPERQAYSIAREMGFNIVGTAYLTGDTAKDNAEMEALIELCNDGLVDVAIVGNETLLDTGNGPKLTATQLIADIQYVRAGVTDSSIPISTADSVDVLLANSSVRNACNLIVAHCYPYWGGSHIDSAAQSFISQINSLKAVSGDKQVLIGETGWPTGGSSNGSAVPNEENAAQYFEQIRDWSVSTGTYVLYFEAFDEPWKSYAGQEGDVGAYWGFMTTERVLKDGYANINFPGPGIPGHNIEDAEISGVEDQTYTGSAVTLNLTVKMGSKTLKSGTDYTVSYSNNTEVGEAAVTITGIGDYTGTVTKKFLILPGASKKVEAKNVASGISLRWEPVAGATYYHIYRGNTLFAETSKLECVDKAVVNNVGQKYTYKVIASKSKKWYSTKARTATMYRLRPVGITSLTSTEPGKMTVKYNNGGVCKGYVVRYGLHSDMSDAKVISVQGVGTTSRTFNNLEKGKTYYVQVRTYMLENDKRYYSGYSYTKSVKIMAAAAPAAPQIALTNVPSYGKYDNLKGKVFMSDASTLDTSKYKILVFIEINENWGYWPKPTFASPYTELKSDGSFTVDFTTGPDDETAKILHVMLVPTSVKISEKGPNPVSDDSFGKIKAKAVDYVRIDRTQSGGITISPRRVAATAIKSVTNSAAGKITVTYGKSANASGYTIRYGLKSDMSDAKSVTASGAGTVSKTISGLTKGKTYYVQVRAYLTENGSKLYSDYSAKKSVKITK